MFIKIIPVVLFLWSLLVLLQNDIKPKKYNGISNTVPLQLDWTVFRGNNILSSV